MKFFVFFVLTCSHLELKTLVRIRQQSSFQTILHILQQQSGVKEEDGTSSDYEYEKFRQSKSVGYHGKPPKKKHHSKNNKVSPLRHQGSMGYRGSSKRQTTLTLSR